MTKEELKAPVKQAGRSELTDTAGYIKTAEAGIPVLCLWGENDKTMPYYQAERFREVMPKAVLVTL